MDRPWLSPEERAKEAEEENRGRQANELLDQAASGNLAAGTYKWNGTAWVRTGSN